MKKALSLTEILITLGIIGIVASLTIPVITINIQKEIAIKQLKTSFNTLSNAIELAKTYYDGQLILTDEMKDGGIELFLTTFIDPYIKDIKFWTPKHVSLRGVTGETNNFNGYNSRWRCVKNGMCYYGLVQGSRHADGTAFFNYIYLMVDTNGIDKGPNKKGRDFFYMNVDTEKDSVISLSHKNYDFRYAKPQTYENIKNSSCNHANESYWNGVSCFALIVMDNWKIGKDYPW